jgi:hypothetical protein
MDEPAPGDGTRLLWLLGNQFEQRLPSQRSKLLEVKRAIIAWISSFECFLD